MALKLVSEGFENGGRIPPRYTREGENTSPPFYWEEAPEDAGSLVLIMEDADARQGPVTHWIVYDIPAELKGLPQGPCGLCKIGRNDFAGVCYAGPDPYPGDPQHRYCFRLYAIDAEELGLPHGATRAQLDAALSGRVLDEAELIGLYGRTMEHERRRVG
ncbi:MAG: YbhB/YbcL family Raf kinase inhibitor-like protein [Planctomycetota bacterium]